MIRAVRQLRVASDKVNRVAGIHYKVLGRKTDTELQSFLFPARGEGEDNLTRFQFPVKDRYKYNANAICTTEEEFPPFNCPR